MPVCRAYHSASSPERFHRRSLPCCDAVSPVCRNKTCALRTTDRDQKLSGPRNGIASSEQASGTTSNVTLRFPHPASPDADTVPEGHGVFFGAH